MAGLSGIVKKISDLVTGTPADDDCFIFGKTDLKKITLAKLKDALGITSINSDLTVSTQTRNEGSFLDIYVAKNEYAAQVRSAAYLKHKITVGTEQQLYNLNLSPVYSIYRRYKISDGKEYILRIDADGILYIRPLGSDLDVDDAINFTEFFFIK